MLLQQWDVEAENEQCVLVKIHDDVDIENLELTLINEVRIPIIKVKVESREMHICSPTEKPMFCQLGNSVKYVKGSGSKSYLIKNV